MRPQPRSGCRPVRSNTGSIEPSGGSNASTATAGGPTSVIIVNPATAEAGALYINDTDYQVLHDALAPATDISVEWPAQLAQEPGRSAINITWLIHDVEVWRIDHVRIDLKYVRVNTTTMAGAAPYQADGQWRVAAGAEAVIGVLDRLGVLSDGSLAKGGWDVTESGNAAGAPAGEGDAAATAGAEQPMSSAPPIVPAWQWLVASRCERSRGRRGGAARAGGIPAQPLTGASAATPGSRGCR